MAEGVSRAGRRGSAVDAARAPRLGRVDQSEGESRSHALSLRISSARTHNARLRLTLRSMLLTARTWQDPHLQPIMSGGFVAAQLS
jgi:hypothetical protein